MLRHRLLVVTSALALVPACESPDQGRDDAGPDPGIHLPGGAEDGGDAEDPAATENELLGSMTDAFDAAARDYDIPVEVLKSIAFAETRWEMIIGEEEFDGHPAAFGAMALRGDQVARGAELTGHDEVQVKFVAAANIRAGAAILDEIADGMTFDRDDLGAWAPAIAAYSGIEDAEAQAGYIHNEVYAVMRSGILLPTLEGNVSMMGGIDVEPDFQQPLPHTAHCRNPFAAQWIDHPVLRLQRQIIQIQVAAVATGLTSTETIDPGQRAYDDGIRLAGQQVVQSDRERSPCRLLAERADAQGHGVPLGEGRIPARQQHGDLAGIIVALALLQGIRVTLVGSVQRDRRSRVRRALMTIIGAGAVRGDTRAVPVPMPHAQ